MIRGTGVDLVALPRIQRLLDRYGDRFVTRWFTPAEIAACAPEPEAGAGYAALLAAKEAVAKAVGVDPRGAVPWRHIEIATGDRGQTSVRLSGPMLARATAARIDRVTVSFAVRDELAVAFAVATTEA